MTISINGQVQTYATIQEAVDAAVDGDIVLVSAGTFREQVTVSGKDITIQGAGAGQTIIESPDAASLAVATSMVTAALTCCGPTPPVRRRRG